MSDSYASMSPAELTELQMLLDGWKHCSVCVHGWGKKEVCDSCSEEAHQKENVRRYGNVPVMKEWNPLERKPDELLEHPYMAEARAATLERHAN